MGKIVSPFVAFPLLNGHPPDVRLYEKSMGKWTHPLTKALSGVGNERGKKDPSNK